MRWPFIGVSTTVVRRQFSFLGLGMRTSTESIELADHLVSGARFPFLWGGAVASCRTRSVGVHGAIRTMAVKV